VNRDNALAVVEAQLVNTLTRVQASRGTQTGV
jgi:hypothetical protein